MICSIQALYLIPCYSDSRQQVHGSAALATIVHMPMWCTVSEGVKCSDWPGIFIYLFIYFIYLFISFIYFNLVTYSL